ncbi:unnamed protein product [Oncorhynchus mykiss]|uniref:GAT domain-containing protein n=1 Tax=Oncorhynchus mykiss TaxID=8022 RepID=A0A060YUH9_ONCMY|nr:unnamed protein product [Oncorhynchus mykiss]
MCLCLQDLYQSCEKMRPTLFRLASDTEDNDEALADILQANDSLTQVINLYRQLVKGEEVNGDSTAMPTLPGEREGHDLNLQASQRGRHTVLHTPIMFTHAQTEPQDIQHNQPGCFPVHFHRCVQCVSFSSFKTFDHKDRRLISPQEVAQPS